MVRFGHSKLGLRAEGRSVCVKRYNRAHALGPVPPGVEDQGATRGLLERSAQTACANSRPFKKKQMHFF